MTYYPSATQYKISHNYVCMLLQITTLLFVCHANLGVTRFAVQQPPGGPILPLLIT